MKQLLWSTLTVLILIHPAYADETKVVGKWRAEDALTSKDKPHIAWVLELEKGGTFRMTELAPNVSEKLKKEMETGRWWIIEPSLTEKLKSVIQKTETRVRLQFAPTPDDVKRGETREYFGRVVEKNERYNGKMTLHLTLASQVVTGGRMSDRVPSSYVFIRAE